MSDGFRNFTAGGVGFTPQAADPTSPKEGDIFRSDGTSRAEGLWQYKGGAWVFMTEGTAGSLVTVAKSATFTALTSEDYYVVDTTAGDVTANLPTAVGNSGKQFIFVKIDSSTNELILDGNGTETINDELTAYVSSQYKAVKIISDGTEWFITSSTSSGIAYVAYDANASRHTITTSPTAIPLDNLYGDNVASLAANQITLLPGKYDISTRAFFQNAVSGTDNATTYIYNVTDAVEVTNSRSNQNRGDTDGTSMHMAEANFPLSITATKVFEIRVVKVGTSALMFVGDDLSGDLSKKKASIKITKLG